MQSQLDSTLLAYFQEFAELVPERGLCLSFDRFCHFLSHTQIFTSSFDHKQALQIFLEAQTGGVNAERITPLDITQFRIAIAAVARRIHGDGEQGGGPAARGKDIPYLNILVRDIHLVRTTAFNPELCEGVMSPTLAPEVVQAAYCYSESIRALFRLYATDIYGESSEHVPWQRIAKPRSKDISSLCCRNAHRLCGYMHLVPQIVVAGEFVDLTKGLIGKELNSNEKKYFAERYMLEKGLPESNWAEPSAKPASEYPGEPRYDLPGFIELLISIALCRPPRVFKESAEVRAQRVHDVFGEYLRLPRDLDPPASTGGFDARQWLDHLQRRMVLSSGNCGQVAYSSLPMDRSLSAVLAKLNVELPRLAPPPREPTLPQPPPGAKLLPTPTPIDDVVKLLRKLGPSSKVNAKMTDKVKLAARKNIIDSARPQWNGVEHNKVTWIERPPPKALPGPTEEFLSTRGVLSGKRAAGGIAIKPGERRYEMLERLRESRAAEKRELRSLEDPAQGYALRLTLIDEPLLAPRCVLSEEVSTLIETALVSRRLRNYTIAIAMLIRARTLWAKLAARREVPRPYARFETLMPPLSPWGPPPHVRFDNETDDVSGEEQDICSNNHQQGSPKRFPAQEHDMLECEGGIYDAKRDFFLALGDSDPSLRHLPPEVGLFFLYELASLHEALREDDLAAQLHWRGRVQADALPPSHPDQAVVWCGLSRVAFHAGHPDVAARALVRVRKIRERTIGGDTMETATTYNNLACCFVQLERILEAIAHLDIAVELLRTLGGDEHPRTQVALRNLEKARASPKHVQMSFPYLFTIPVPDTTKGALRRMRRVGRSPKPPSKGDGSSLNGKNLAKEATGKKALKRK